MAASPPGRVFSLSRVCEGWFETSGLKLGFSGCASQAGAAVHSQNGINSVLHPPGVSPSFATDRVPTHQVQSDFCSVSQHCWKEPEFPLTFQTPRTKLSSLYPQQEQGCGQRITRGQAGASQTKSQRCWGMQFPLITWPEPLQAPAHWLQIRHLITWKKCPQFRISICLPHTGKNKSLQEQIKPWGSTFHEHFREQPRLTSKVVVQFQGKYFD